MAKRTTRKQEDEAAPIGAQFMTGWKVLAGYLRERPEVARTTALRFVQREAARTSSHVEYVRGLRAAYSAAVAR